MNKFFNTSGPVKQDKHYNLDPLTRLDWKEVIPRELTWIPQGRIIEQEQIWYVQPDGKLNMPKLLGAFQQFFRENSAIAIPISLGTIKSGKKP